MEHRRFFKMSLYIQVFIIACLVSMEVSGQTPLCNPSCKNFGICVEGNKCECPTNFSGKSCEIEDKPCVGYPVLPMASGRRCSSTQCEITCMDGYKLADGTSTFTISCVNGKWHSSRPDGNTSPMCLPQCTTACLNGGQCMGVDTCRCAKGFRGPQCQYRESDCNARKMGFNGGYSCFGDGEKLNCRLKCPVGASFSSPPAPFYTCQYSTGVYQPQPIPKCVFN